MVAGRRAAVEVGCEEVEEERARVGGDAVVLCLWLNVEPVRLRGDQSMRCAASVYAWQLDRCMALVSYLDTARRPVSFLAKKARFVTTSKVRSCHKAWLFGQK